MLQSSRPAQLAPDTDSAKVAINAAHALRGKLDCENPFAAGRPVDSSTHTSATESKGRQPFIGAVPILARLPLVSPGRLSVKSATPSLAKSGYRIDPPQTERGNPPAATESRSEQRRPLRSELVFAPRQAQKPRPHVFDWARTKEQRAQDPRIETKHLPRSNTFSQRRKITLGSVGPLLRFVTIAILFAAAGTWFQLNAFREEAAQEEMEPPKTANRETIPAGKSVERPLPMPTAVGPVTAPSESGSSMRVGDARDAGGYATLPGYILPVPSPAGSLATSVTSVELHPGALPRVRTAEPAVASSGSADHAPIADRGLQAQPLVSSPPNNGAEIKQSTTPEIARLPGFVDSSRGTQSR